MATGETDNSASIPGPPDTGEVVIHPTESVPISDISECGVRFPALKALSDPECIIFQAKKQDKKGPYECDFVSEG